jgi:hypothetical protein
MSTLAFYDEDGVYHFHDPNWHAQTYRCSNGHIVKRTWLPNCPASGCPMRRREQKITVEDQRRPSSSTHTDTSASPSSTEA